MRNKTAQLVGVTEMRAPNLAVKGCPGTGKTEWVANFVAERVSQGLDPSDIATSTFRVPLAADIRQKIAERGVKLPKDHLFRTTHGICNQLLNPRHNGVATPSDKLNFCRDLGIDYSIENSSINDLADIEPHGTLLGNQLFGIRSYCANNFLDSPDDYMRAPITVDNMQRLSSWLVERFESKWAKYKEEHDLIDYVDQLQRVFENKLVPNVRVLVEEEFQDKTPLQYEIFKIWAQEIEEVYATGDALQAIYEFFGTNPAFFNEVYDAADERLVLKTAYRFGQNVWDYARAILRAEGMDAPNLNCTGHTEIRHISWESVVTNLPRYRDANCFFLARANYMAQPIIDALVREGIPYSGYGGALTERARSLYNALCTAREMIPPQWHSFFGIPHEGLSIPPDVATLLLDALPAACFDGVKKRLQEQFKDMVNLESLPRLPITPLFYELVTSKTPFLKMLSRTFQNNDQREALQRIFTQRGGKPLEETHTVSTIHGSKGRQSDFNFLFDELPPRTYQHMDPKNEARLFYVGVTRTHKCLFIVHGPFGSLSYPFPREATE